MKVRNLAAVMVVALSLPVAAQGSAFAQDNLVPSASNGTDTQANIDQAKERLDKAKIRFEISQKQVDAAKARLKAADAEFKAAKANFEARNLDHQAKKLSDASGLPEITEGQIEQNRNKAIASKEVEAVKEESTPVVTPSAPPAAVDLSQTRLNNQVDFNGQPDGNSGAPVAQPSPPSAQPAGTDVQSDVPTPAKQALIDAPYPAPQQVAATTSAPMVSDQPPIVP
jgi:hypothetical protein